MKEKAAIWEDIKILNPWKKNPRKNTSAIDKVADSIKRFGFASPIIARSEDKIIIAGHTRFEAAKKLGLDQVPVRYLDLDPADSRLLALADNRLGEIATWDEDLLSEVLRDMIELDRDIGSLGFDEDEFESLLNDKIDYVDDDDFEDHAEPVSGDIRQVVLRFTPEEHDVFMSCMQSLSSRLGTTNNTDTIIEVLKNA